MWPTISVFQSKVNAQLKLHFTWLSMTFQNIQITIQPLNNTVWCKGWVHGTHRGSSIYSFKQKWHTLSICKTHVRTLSLTVNTDSCYQIGWIYEPNVFCCTGKGSTSLTRKIRICSSALRNVCNRSIWCFIRSGLDVIHGCPWLLWSIFCSCGKRCWIRYSNSPSCFWHRTSRGLIDRETCKSIKRRVFIHEIDLN